MGEIETHEFSLNMYRIYGNALGLNENTQRNEKMHSTLNKLWLITEVRAGMKASGSLPFCNSECSPQTLDPNMISTPSNIQHATPVSICLLLKYKHSL